MEIKLFISDCSTSNSWCLSQYVPLYAPQSPCVSLQWTCRDGKLVNLPAGLIVEGDIILLRPGHVVLAKCKPMNVCK